MKLTQTETRIEALSGEYNLSIGFKGLGLLHRGESNWRCWFPNIKGHDLTLEIKKLGINPTKFLIPAGSTIEVSLEIEDQRAENTSFSDQILNVTSEKLHKDGLKVRDDNDKEISKLKFRRDINLFSDGESQEFYIWKCDVSGRYKEKTDPVEIKGEVFSVIRCKPGSTTRIIIRGQINAEFSLLQDDDSQYEVIFNNDCESAGCATSSDYYFYYTLISLPTEENKFELIQDTQNPSRAPEPMCDIVYGNKLDYTAW